MGSEATVVVGLIGYYPFVRAYPLGPALREGLLAAPWFSDRVELREMNWGPIAVVQDLQAEAEKPVRIVLVAAVDRQRTPGTVRMRCWTGGELPVLAVQDRVFEAVTGIVSVDNLLVIGEHFGAWPDELVVVEVQLASDAVGRLVLEELSDPAVAAGTPVGDRPPDAAALATVAAILDACREAVTRPLAELELTPLGVADLNPLAEICHNQLIRDCRNPGALH